MRLEGQRNKEHHTQERRHDAGRRATLLGWVLGLAAAIIVLFLVCYLLFL